MKSLLKELGVSDRDTLVRVIPPMVHREDIADLMGYVRHDGSPVASITPEYIGQKVYDYTNKDFYIGIDTSANTDWALIALDTLSLTELAFLDGITAGTALASKAVVLSATKGIDSFRVTDRLFKTMPAPATATDTATLSTAQVLNQVLVATPTAAAAYTLPTGAALDAALLAAYPGAQANDSYDWTIINIGGTGDDITVTAPASGITLVGDAVVRPSADSATEQAGQGTFRVRRTAADTFIMYRVA